MDITDLVFAAWISESYLKRAYAASDLDYEAVQTIVSRLHAPPGRNPAEICCAAKGSVALDSTADILAAEAKATADGSAIYVIYDHVNLTGLKLFDKDQAPERTASPQLLFSLPMQVRALAPKLSVMDELPTRFKSKGQLSANSCLFVTGESFRKGMPERVCLRTRAVGTTTCPQFIP